ncbi:MAG: Gfo/Idh/MocA family oxidoreductase [Anaerolineales bacterium]|nr:Gfo/Idh/MocA family oxidoreductase [Anaerolineales bacterium]
MRFLICGLGSIGRRHLRNLVALNHADIVLLRSGKSTLPEEDLKDFPTEHDIEIALERGKPDAVIVSNPTAVHLNIAIPAAEAGCHLLIEKPISHSMDQIDSLKRAMEERKPRVLVGYQFRYHPSLRNVKKLLKDGVIGEVISARVYWGEYLPGWHPWEDYRQSYSARSDLGGGVILTLSHPFDYLRWLLGEVHSVSANYGITGVLDLDVEDTAEVILQFQSGAFANVHLDYITQPPKHWIELVGSKGSLRWDNADGAVHWWTESTQGWLTLTAPEGFERNHLFLEEMEHFIDVIDGAAQPICTLDDGIRALEIALGAIRSGEEGCRVVLDVEEKEHAD